MEKKETKEKVGTTRGKVEKSPFLHRIGLIERSLPWDIPDDPEEALKWVLDKSKECRACPLADNRNSVVDFDGTISAQIMVIGEGPGFLEDLCSGPLVGPIELNNSHCSVCSKFKECYGPRLLDNPRSWGRKSKPVKCEPNYTDGKTYSDKFYLRSAGAIFDGILLNSWGLKYPRHNWVKKLGLETESPFFVTNSTLCRSWDTITGSDKSPTHFVRKACRPWLTVQWAAVNPKIILALGRAALGTLMMSDKAAESVRPGQIIETKFGTVLFTFHPAAIMRQDQKEKKAYGYAKLKRAIEITLEHCGYIEV